MQQCIKILLFPYLYEAYHVSGDTPPIIRSLKLHWQPLVFYTSKVGGRVAGGHCQAQCAWQRPTATRPTNFDVWKTRGCQCSFRLLMMGGVSPETCWASYKYGNNKIFIHCCILLDFSLRIKKYLNAVFWPRVLYLYRIKCCIAVWVLKLIDYLHIDYASGKMAGCAGSWEVVHHYYSKRGCWVLVLFLELSGAMCKWQLCRMRKGPTRLVVQSHLTL